MDSPVATAAYLTMVSQYASVGGLAVLIWDIIDNIPGDYRILFVNQKTNLLNVPTIVYILSRLGTFAYALTSVIFDTAPVGHCDIFHRISVAWCPFSLGATAFLFFLRLRAVYNRDRLIVSTFFILWLAVFVGSILGSIDTKGVPVMDPGNIATGYCEEISVSALSFYTGMAPLVFDTLILLAISWRLSRLSHEPGVNVGRSVNLMLFGTDLPTFTRSLLIDGQIYYLITVITGVACAILFFSPFVPVPLSDMMEDVYPAVVNIMACRLFRRTKSGAIRESSSTTSNRTHLPPMQFAASSSFLERASKGVVDVV